MHVRNLKTVQDVTRNSPIYQPGAGGNYNQPEAWKTWCNQSTYDVAEATGFTDEAMYDGANRYNVRANSAAVNLAEAAKNGLVTEVTPEMAQNLANQGFTVVAAQVRPGIGHLSTVRPSAGNYDPLVGPLLSNVGASNGVKPTTESFSKKAFSSGSIHFYYDPRQTFVFDISNAASVK